MSDALDEGLVQRIDARGTIEWSETCYRYTGAHRDALSGEGARRFGGRWNPENDDIYGDDWSGCQAVGHAAWFLHMQGVLVPAAGGVGLVVTAYEQRTRPGQLQLRQSVDLTPALYQELRAT